ncbi:aromatic acid exporter family protein [Enterococcus dispar]|uniref:aromatic acid exporter family protein n=1 Tax=Enterococcus dispar TaxID=44009 RepID=UPI00232C9F04|nr:aromatic acid exporter family protein [Enterococcus dispar]WCG33099.1 aromatic acid exporter family protein [Enterococcus dispar]
MKIGLRTIKTVIAASLAMFFAQLLNLLYAPAAGIIAVLSVGNTKKATLLTAFYRVISLIIATIISFFCFNLLGFNPFAFGVFLLLFIPVSVYFNLEDGIVVNSVLVTHYLSENSFAWQIITNEFLLMSLGVGLALLANLYMPDIGKTLKEEQVIVEVMFKKLLGQLANGLNLPSAAKKAWETCGQLGDYLAQAQIKANRHQQNYWFQEDSSFATYFTMRRGQVLILRDMIRLLDQIEVEEEYVADMRYLLQTTAKTFGYDNDGRELLQLIAAISRNYEASPLPKNRLEFENRARLFQFLQLFTSFIETKAEFSRRLEH